jgi:CheY-like chemotaxis protein
MKYDAVPPGLPSVILLDLNMPLKNGYQSLQDIKRTPALSGIPVIIVTSSANQKDEADCMKLGCNKFFNKPFSLQGYDELINKILATLGQTRN